MGAAGMSPLLTSYAKEFYPNSKSDLSTVFMEKTIAMCKEDGYMGMINIPVWMFITSYEKLRERIIKTNRFINMLHFGRGVFGADFGTTSFVISKRYVAMYAGVYRRLYLKHGAVDSVEQKEKWFFENIGSSISRQDNYLKISGFPIAYWLSNDFLNTFEIGVPLGEIAPTRKGMFTGDNDLWLKLWGEVDYTHLFHSQRPYNKGGEYRKWYGNNDYVINWGDSGEEILAFRGAGNINPTMYFRKCITWSLVTSYKASFRAIIDNEHVMGDAGPIALTNDDNQLYLLGLLNSKYVEEVVSLVAPTINFSNGAASTIPVIICKDVKELVDKITSSNIEMSKKDWDSFETSWDFKKHPLI